MRIVRLVGVVLTILLAALLPATPAGAQPPTKLTDHITDNTQVLTDSDRATISSAIDRLYQDQHVQLWVVYVDNFSRYKPENWADKTRTASGMDDHDALLAVATNTKAYAFSVPGKVPGLTAADLNSLRSNKIEPAVSAKDFSGAAVAAAAGLDQSAPAAKPPAPNNAPGPSNRIWLWIAIGGIVVVVIVVVVVLLYRARRRRSARPVDHRDGQRVESLGQALPIADARLRQVSEYVAKHRESIGAEAQSRFEEAKRHLAAARDKEASNEAEAIAHANGASTLAAHAQTLANADVLAAHRAPRRRGTTSAR
ncbi:MAG: TPM domain-containing protein [Actinomycetota bacterium]|uniref:TPM domain-containing protein n=1 Tax=Mycobacterium lentiflavum TaxID=141349 RepID=A0ABY3UMG5_MYCLN|nr:TPM domain-containing protein [Mycobacterium lentiflavum]MEE3064012.1 TPM domain-containing protein [Actinomycetota bacterium]ULP40794.1 TPM domain-containing protein [Mycobacterium lentiflavum]